MLVSFCRCACLILSKNPEGKKVILDQSASVIEVQEGLNYTIKMDVSVCRLSSQCRRLSYTS